MALAALLGIGHAAAAPNPAADDWPLWGRNLAGTRYSPVTQINTGNVAGLRIAWKVRSSRTFATYPRSKRLR